MEQKTAKGLFDVSQAELKELFSFNASLDGRAKLILTFVGVLLTPFSLLGALIFYKKGYRTFMEPNNEFPKLNDLPSIVRLGMILGGVIVWGIIYLLVHLMIWIVVRLGGAHMAQGSTIALGTLGLNIVLSFFVWLWFNKWRGGIYNYMSEKKRHGTARLASESELLPYRQEQGFYIGHQTFYKKPGHLISVAGTRAGKSVNLILMNLLCPYLFKKMSWVVIDPKGELYAISANRQRKAKRKTILLNTWQLLKIRGVSYNALDILNKNDGINLIDDIEMIAEAIVPTGKGGEEDHFIERARTFIATLLLHLVTAAPKAEHHLGTVWQWLRLKHVDFIELLADMMLNDDPHFGETVRAGANEIHSLMKHSEREYGSIISTAQKCTNFMKSRAMRESMMDSDEFTSADLASGNVTVYVCIPFERLKTHSAWLRLVVTSLMRSVVRNPQSECCFLIDEAFSFGYHSEIEQALSAYAGFGIHVWSIFQNLTQIKKLYGDNWEGFISGCSVRHFFNISDNFSTKYISEMCGTTSVPSYDDKGNVNGASPRPLITPDELRRESGETIYTIIDQLAPTEIPKVPYYKLGLECDPNPYYKPGDN